MTAPLFLAGPSAPTDPPDLGSLRPGGEVRLGGDEARHAVSVRRLRPGEQVLLGDGAGLRVGAVVAAAEPSGLRLRVESVEREPAPSPRFVLVQALAKAGRDEQVVEQATELGVDEVVAWQAERSVVVWRGDRAERSRRRWELVARAAAKQSRRAWLPVVSGPERTPQLCRRVAGASLALLLHESATQPLAEVSLPGGGEVVLVVGPEGGISDAELGVLAGAGAVAVRLGSTVLRTSTAGPAALAVLSAAARWR
ncbi:MAG TPA: 16S rRNA (uracil(1498)-N(3))-methyltransferase [Dermatophilaceae bacterium]|nr:16S rRNA (uracil(1498)-N(3))-methyltransferase [Dermatophilaceae bacterium]